jgi:predicted phage tail protein
LSINRAAKGIVLVPTLLLGSAFIATAVWGPAAAADNKSLALGVGGVLIAAGLLAQLMPEPAPEAKSEDEP